MQHCGDVGRDYGTRAGTASREAVRQQTLVNSLCGAIYIIMLKHGPDGKRRDGPTGTGARRAAETLARSHNYNIQVKDNDGTSCLSTR